MKCSSEVPSSLMACMNCTNVAVWPAANKCLVTQLPRLLCLLLLPMSASADVIYLNNGDRITGEIVRVVNEKITIDPEYGGAYDERDDINVDNSVGSGSVFFAVDTPIGPRQLGIGAADNGQFSYYARIGHLF